MPPNDADVVELVDTIDLGSIAERCGGSSPFIRTNERVKALNFNSLTLLLFQNWRLFGEINALNQLNPKIG